MFKKIMLLSLLLMVLAGHLFANGVDSQGEDPKLRQMAVDFLIENGFKEDVDSEYFEIEVLPNDKMIIPYESYKAYSIRFQGDVDEWKYRRVLIKGDKIFNSYTDFNKILKNEGIIIDSTNAFEIVSDYLHLIKGKNLRIEKMNWINSEYKFIPGFAERAGIKEKYFFSVEVFAYNRINGLKLIYLIGFKNGYIRIMQTEILDFYQGDYIKDETIPTPKRKKYNPDILEINQLNRERGLIDINNYSDNPITFDKDDNPHNVGSPIPFDERIFLKENNVIIKNDDSGTPTLQRTVDIYFNGYTEYANTTQQIIMAIWGTTHFIIDNSDNVTINFNGSGYASLEDYILPDDVASGVYSLFITGEHENRMAFYLYETKTDNLTPSYPSIVYFYDQITNFDEPEIDTISNNVQTSIAQVYQTEVVDWNLPSPPDYDSKFDLYITARLKAATQPVNNHSLFKYIQFGYPVIENFRTTYNYATDMDVIQSVLSHEFLHSIQFHWPHIFEHWGGGVNYEFITEGQATFIQTLYMDEIAGAGNNGEEYLNGRFFQTKSNEYLTGKLNASVTEQSYNFCLFWRFLFETNIIGSDAEKLEILTDLLGASYGVDPVSCSEIMFNSVLSNSDGAYNSFDEALKKFATNCYLNDTLYTRWDPCPNDAFYVTPAITASNREGITNTFTGERNVTETDIIAEPFGIDYMVFNIGGTVSNVCLSFDGDPDDNSNMADFYANALLMEGNNLISEQEILLTNGEGVISFEPNDPANIINKIVLVIARLDSDETRENDYEVTLSDDEMHISGNVSGTWSNTYSTYIIDGDITVSSGNTLIIEPGVKVNFSGHYKFNINGRLLAEGTEDANIIFTAQNQTTGWNGLHFINQNTNGQDSSKVVYCKLQYGRATDAYPNNCGGAIYLENSDILIDNCIISYNSAVRDGGGIYVYNSSSPIISNSLICNNSASYNGGGIHIINEDYDMCYPSFNNLTIVNNSATNKGGGIYCEHWSHPTITNSTFYGNSASSGGGFYSQYLLNYVNYPSLLNCILWNDTPSEIVATPITVTYSDIQGGFSGDGNIDANPLFADPANGDFQITWANYPVDDATKSPCIDTGNSSSTLDPDDTIADMGAFYFHQYETGLSAPEDVIVTIDADSIHITWSAARNRNTYKVYSSNDPYLDFTEDLTGTYNETSWTAPFPIADDKKFYYVTSSDEEQRLTYKIPQVKGK